ncbi:MAG: prolipoprotein diacylglyceryl transferase [bacterium]|nr:prolipoprotein diacylglyceryl transferase [bacterium]
MYPEIFRIGPFALHSYGLMVFIGFATGIWFAAKRAEKKGYPKEMVYDVSLWILIASLVGARGLYVLTHSDEFKGRWLDAISPIQSDGTIGIAGLVLLGGVILSIVAVYLFSKRKKISFWLITDLLVPSLALGEFFGRIGCFLNGCCFGIPTHFFLGVVFPSTCAAGAQFPDTHIHPTQLYMSLTAILTFFILLIIESRLSRLGQLFGIYLIIYGITRFIIEDFRWYESSMILFQGNDWYITISQMLSIIMVIAGTAIFFSKKLPEYKSKEPTISSYQTKKATKS